MDPNQQYYQQQSTSNSRSLSSTTDPHLQDPRYQQNYMQTAGYPQTQGQGYQQSAVYYPNDPRRVPHSTSYPGAVPQTHQMAYAGTHAVSAPGALPYPSPSQAPHAQSAAAPGAYRAQPAQHAPVPTYPPSSSYTQEYFTTPAQGMRLTHGGTSSAGYASHSHQAHAHAYAPPASPEGSERFPCDKCDKTFSRAHDRKRHHESQHSTHPYFHRCRFCNKEFSRADSLKRHIDNGCEKDPAFQPE
ncbi:hypothetical protein PsYK624_089110 [Phanerochaete sordida]|uniref:C2H2-type domain-containing protein n=1 Tax=Phanerochaete sordida TaxID=48140 RepID=A0A9P3LEY7_9APHY|nr:hypothetical protein PsYK624_089110 [Phanerochaete sordida]